jgi:exodeoxyribonuclease VII small subunit
MPKAPAGRDAAEKSAGQTPANFESAMEELEKIVARMESGDLSLEDSLAAHKRGLELAQYCQGVLVKAQQQVKVLEEGTLKALSEVSPDE